MKVGFEFYFVYLKNIDNDEYDYNLKFDFNFNDEIEAIEWTLHFIKEFLKCHDDYALDSVHVFKYRNFERIIILEF